MFLSARLAAESDSQRLSTVTWRVRNVHGLAVARGRGHRLPAI
jgi:hypothetical protein